MEDKNKLCQRMERFMDFGIQGSKAYSDSDSDSDSETQIHIQTQIRIKHEFDLSLQRLIDY